MTIPLAIGLDRTYHQSKLANLKKVVLVLSLSGGVPEPSSE